MAKKKGGNADWKYVLGNMRKADTLARLSSEKEDARTSVRDTATQELNEISYEFAKRTTSPKTNQPYIPDPNRTPIEKVEQSFLDDMAGFAQGMAYESAANRFYSNLDDIVDRQMGKSVLESLVESEDIQKAASNDDTDIIGSYQLFTGTKRLLKKYEAGDKLSDKQREGLDKLARIGAGKFKADELKKLGYSAKLQNMAAKLAQESVRLGYFDDKAMEKFTVTGMNEQIAEAKRAYDTIVSDSGGRDVYDAVRGSLKTLANGSKDEFNKALNIVYSAKINSED